MQSLISANDKRLPTSVRESDAGPSLSAVDEKDTSFFYYTYIPTFDDFSCVNLLWWSFFFSSRYLSLRSSIKKTIPWPTLRSKHGVLLETTCLSIKNRFHDPLWGQNTVSCLRRRVIFVLPPSSLHLALISIPSRNHVIVVEHEWQSLQCLKLLKIDATTSYQCPPWDDAWSLISISRISQPI